MKASSGSWSGSEGHRWLNEACRKHRERRPPSKSQHCRAFTELKRSSKLSLSSSQPRKPCIATHAAYNKIAITHGVPDQKPTHVYCARTERKTKLHIATSQRPTASPSPPNPSIPYPSRQQPRTKKIIYGLSAKPGQRRWITLKAD